jgi:hypothetical protein
MISQPSPSPPYRLVLTLWLKGQWGVLFAGAVMLLGSFLLSPQLPLERRVIFTLLLPAMLEIGFSAFCGVMALRLWRIRAVLKAGGQ